MKKILLSFSLALATLNAQTIQDIKFSGLVHISDAIAKEIIGLKIGDKINPSKVNQSIKKLYAQQYFSDVWVDEENGILEYHVTEKPIIAKVGLVGMGKDKAEEALNSAGIKKGDVYDENKIANVKKKLVKDLEKKGYFDSVVEIENEQLNEGSLSTNVVINQGENIYIKKIHLYGTKDFKYSDFEPYVANKEQQVAGWLLGRNDGKLKADQLKYDALRIKEFYLKNGYLDIKVDGPYLKTNFSNYTAELTYRINEGKQYKINSITLEFDDSIVNKNDIKENLKLKETKVFNVEKLRKDVSKISRKFSDKGYAFAQTIPDVKQNREAGTVDITFRVKPNNKAYVNNITIAGNSRTLDRVIRRELYLSEGEEFKQGDLQDSTNALRRTGYFNNVNIQTKQVTEDKIDLLVNVNEASTGSIMGGISYGSYDGFGINAGISDRNFLGTGIEVGTDIDYSEKTLKGSLNFYNPRLFDSIYSIGGNIYRKDYDYINYQEETLGASLKLGRKIQRNLHVSLAYIYEETELSELSDALKDNNFYREGKFTKSAIIPSITYDNTDDYYLPRHGINIGLSSEIAGLGGDSDFIRNSINAKYYYGLEDLIDYDLIIRLKARASIINDRGDESVGAIQSITLPLNERLYLGGMGTVRGYKHGTLAPKNEEGDLLGAKKMASASLELSVPLIESVQLRLMGFYDYGMTGEDDFSDIHRSSVGAGLEWAKSPLGVPLQIFYAHALDEKEGDSTSKIEFNLGRRF